MCLLLDLQLVYDWPHRRVVIETSRSLKELFHEARERASKALGFAKMLRKVGQSKVSLINHILCLLLITHLPSNQFYLIN